MTLFTEEQKKDHQAKLKEKKREVKEAMLAAMRDQYEKEAARLYEQSLQGKLAWIKKEILAMSESSSQAPKKLDKTLLEDYRLEVDRWAKLVQKYKSLSGLPPTARLDF